MTLPKLYRKRFMPNEVVYLKDDIIVYQDENVMVTKWDVLHPKAKFSHGVSCYYMDKGWKISKFLNKNDELVYYYCDIIDTTFHAEENFYVFTDLLADVIIYEDGSVKVVDLGEIADALEEGIITDREVKLALRRLDALLEVIYSGGLPEMIRFMETKV
ncbi:MAG: DUF402 domain-containing protein [Eubacterium sp.]|nr:DUF402 domain-containing protein [Anaerotignum sp.]MBQ7757461.1 DUF402 domain-containing protein [Anaerotignum sp.]MBQ8662465.1 DUF402 domain-containing protein [Eubacterium sp.]